jgi:hypothetical protein
VKKTLELINQMKADGVAALEVESFDNEYREEPS